MTLRKSKLKLESFQAFRFRCKVPNLSPILCESWYIVLSFSYLPRRIFQVHASGLVFKSVLGLPPEHHSARQIEWHHVNPE